MTPCTAPRCRDEARWAVADRKLCRRHMLDALLASGFGQAYAVPLEAEQVEAPPEPAARLTDEERERVSVVADWAAEHLGQDDPGVVALRALMERLT